MKESYPEMFLSDLITRIKNRWKANEIHPPLGNGEEMTVHFDDEEFVIKRTK